MYDWSFKVWNILYKIAVFTHFFFSTMHIARIRIAMDYIIAIKLYDKSEVAGAWVLRSDA
jgi:hypothetical protein